ncbi:MAG: aquaporin [Phycisphaerae bacterium]|nr:aquaporin [Phycisphaerae bacterium]
MDALHSHWPEYLMEAALLGAFMVSACLCGVVLEHPCSGLRRRIGRAFIRRLLAGLAMGVTAILLIYSPWGARSGAHMNPATTLAFWSRGKIAAPDALFYVLSQFVGGALGVALCRILLRERLRHPFVDHVVTVPGQRGAAAAWTAELLIAFVMMLTVLYASNDPFLTPYTGFLAAGLLVIYIALEAPLSGMSLNPARSFGSAVVARRWTAFWVYLTAPVIGMLLASAVPDHSTVYCAKLNHCNQQRCIFRCEFDRLAAIRDDRPAANVARR